MEKKQTVEELEEKVKILLHREKSHEEFIYMATHELKSPITVLKAYLQLVSAKLNKDRNTQYLPLVEKMDFQLNRILHIATDLLDAAKSDSGSIYCLMNPMDLNEAISNCYDGFKTTNPEFLIQFALPEQASLIRGDRDRIEQVISNLLTNAIKYSDQEKVVRISCERQGDRIFVKVMDKGIGIPDDKKKEVFERFYRVNASQTGEYSGLGLGLYISMQIIRSHGGEMGVYDNEQKGSVFWFSIPAKN